MAELMRTAGAERVSEAAAEALAAVLLEKGLEIARDAVKFAAHAGRKTIKREDIELARKGA
jgi:histone H3/H4